MLDKVRKIAMTLAALGALGLGGAAIAGAADNGTSSGSTSTTADSSRPAQARQPRDPLSADVAAKVKAAALAKVPGATVVRTEAGGPGSACRRLVAVLGEQCGVELGELRGRVAKDVDDARTVVLGQDDLVLAGGDRGRDVPRSDVGAAA